MVRYGGGMSWLHRPRYSRIEMIALFILVGGLLSLALMGCPKTKPVLVDDPVDDTGVCEDTGQPDPRGMS